MMFEVLFSVAALLCLVTVVLGCLDCLLKKKRFEAFGIRDGTRAQHNAAFSVDIFDADNNSEQVIIEPLPDILSKVTALPVLHRRITCTERGKQEATLSLLSVQKSFPRSNVTYLKEIGTGWFGKVIESEAIQIVPESNASRVVVKMLKDDASKSEQKQFMEEINSFRCLEHANLLSFLGQCTETTPYLVILEFAAHGNLKSYLVQHRHDIDTQAASNRLLGFALGAASGLACLHRHDYIHNDLAARNCLVMSDNTLKIGDYGISDHLFKDEYFNTGSELLPIRWMAPETLIHADGAWTSQRSTKIADMWSFGILLWEICSLGERPYDSLTDDAVLQSVVQDRQVLPSDVKSKLPFKIKMWSIMIQCWEEPSQRINIEKAHHIIEQVKIQSYNSDFDQKWSHLESNQGKGTMTSLANTSILANISATSFASQRFPVTSPELDTTDGLNRDGVIIEMDNYVSAVSSRDVGALPSLKSPAQSVLTFADNLSTFQQTGSLPVSPYQLTLENELKRIPTPSNHLTPALSFDHQVMATTLSLSKGSLSAPQLCSSHSSPSSEYITVDETRGSMGLQEDTLKELSIVDADVSLDSEGMSLNESIDETLKDSFSPCENSLVNNNNIISPFVLSFHEGEEDFSDYVHTSPEPPVDNSCIQSATPTAGASLVQAKDAHDDSLCSKDASIVRTHTQPADDVLCADSMFSELITYVDSITHVNSSMNDFPTILKSTSHVHSDGGNSVLENSNLLEYNNLYNTETKGSKVFSEFRSFQALPREELHSDVSQNLFIIAQDQNSASPVLQDSESETGNDTCPNTEFSEQIQSVEEENHLRSSTLLNSVSDSVSYTNNDNTGFEQSAPLLQSKLFTDSQEQFDSIGKEELFDSLVIVNDHVQSNFSVGLAIEGSGHEPSPSAFVHERLYSEFNEAPSLRDTENTVPAEVSTSSKVKSQSVVSNMHSPCLTEGPTTNQVTNNIEADLSMLHIDSNDYIQKTSSPIDVEDGDFELDEWPSDFQSNLYRCSHISLTDDTEDDVEASSNFKSADVNGEHFREDSQSPVDSETEDLGNNNLENEFETEDLSNNNLESEFETENLSNNLESEFEFIPDEASSDQAQMSPANAAVSPDLVSGASTQPSSPLDFDEDALKIASEIYLSRGLKSPRVFEIPPLETIPEHPPMPELQEDFSNTPSDTGSMEVRYEEMFGGDSFEWDDFYGDSLIGKDLSLHHVPQQQNSVREYDVSDWSMDVDSESIASGTSQQSQPDDVSFGVTTNLQTNISTDSGSSLHLTLDSMFSPQSKSMDSSRETLVSSLLSQRQSPIVSSVSSTNQSNFYSLTEKYDLETDSSSDGLISPAAVLIKTAKSPASFSIPLSPPASPPFSPVFPSGHMKSEQQNDVPSPRNQSTSSHKSFSEESDIFIEKCKPVPDPANDFVDHNSEILRLEIGNVPKESMKNGDQQLSGGDFKPAIDSLTLEAVLGEHELHGEA